MQRGCQWRDLLSAPETIFRIDGPFAILTFNRPERAAAEAAANAPLTIRATKEMTRRILAARPGGQRAARLLESIAHPAAEPPEIAPAIQPEVPRIKIRRQLLEDPNARAHASARRKPGV